MGRVAGGSPKRRQAERRAGKRARGCLGRQPNRGGRRTRSRTARAEGAARGGPGAQGLPRGCAASARGAHRHQLAPRSSLASSPSLRGTRGGGEFRCPDFLTRAPRPSRRVGPPAGRGRPEPGTEQPAAAREEHPCQRHWTGSASELKDNARKSAASMSLAGAASGLCRQPLGVKALAASALRLLVGIVEDKLGANLVAHKVHLRAYQEHDPALESTTTLTPSCVSTTSSNLLTLSV
ncbi:unnamed protein product [Prorocentrum cordatum]|uniref:Uncharacterized protein n=1 Tax=Prorocentrum cordatum TaxID=2364126 RepID=A0ABN9Y5V1_9DINO|nr:unnamed protein product [Polarella glacialis]